MRRRLDQREDDGLHQGAPHPLPRLRQRELHRHPQVQPDVQNLPGRHRGRRKTRSTCGPRPPRASLSTSTTCSAPPAKSCPSALPRSARASATKSPPATSPSAPGSSSRWSWSSSASPDTDLEWFQYWKELSAADWLLSLGMTEENMRLRDHCARGALLLLQGHHRRRVPVPLRLGRAVGHCRPHRL